MRTRRKDKSIRVDWEDGTRVQFYFTAKGEAKSQVAIQHRKLAEEIARTQGEGVAVTIDLDVVRRTVDVA